MNAISYYFLIYAPKKSIKLRCVTKISHFIFARRQLSVRQFSLCVQNASKFLPYFDIRKVENYSYFISEDLMKELVEQLILISLLIYYSTILSGSRIRDYGTNCNLK